MCFTKHTTSVACVTSLLMYVASFSRNVSKVSFLVRFPVRRASSVPTLGVSPPKFLSAVSTRVLLLFMLMFPLFLDLLPVGCRCVVCIVFFCCSRQCVGGCCFARHPALLPLQLSSTTRILHNFRCTTFPNSSMMATKLFWERLSLFTKTVR